MASLPMPHNRPQRLRCYLPSSTLASTPQSPLRHYGDSWYTTEERHPPPVSLYSNNPYTDIRIPTPSTSSYYPYVPSAAPRKPPRSTYGDSRYSTRKSRKTSDVSDSMYFNIYSGTRVRSDKIRDYKVCPSVFASRAYVDIEMRM